MSLPEKIDSRFRGKEKKMAHWFSKAPEEQLAGKTAIITGGGSGIGKATAAQFVAAGANVVICGVPEQLCLDAAEEFRAQGGNVIGMFCDATKADDIQAVIDRTVEEFGGIDILVSTAGISLPRMNAMDATEADWDKIFAVNAKANFFLATAVARQMKEQGRGGKMVIISSQRGISAMKNIALYSITKAAVMGMVRSLAVDFAEYGIQVNGIAPGYVMTPMVEKVFADNPAQQEYVYSRTPSEVKMGSLEEMAEAIYFLCSPVTTYTTGQTLILDGGWSIQ